MTKRRGRDSASLHASLSRPSRAERVSKQLREEISALMMRDMKDPRIHLASVSDVIVSSDLRQARVRISALGEDSERHKVISALRHAEGFLRGALSNRLENLHQAPRLTFELDESIAYSVHMSTVMRQIERDREAAPKRVWPPLVEVIDDIRAVIEKAEVIGCLAHKDADADSLGSALAFGTALRAQGKTVHVMVPSPTPILLEYLPGYDTLGPPPARLDALFTFDCASVARFGDLEPVVTDAPVVVNVDHHSSSEGFGTINLIDPDASATGQVVFELLTALEIPIDKDSATNIYAALFTDTGGFRHENTTEATLRLGAQLLSHGVDAGWVALKSYKSRSVPQVRLEGMAVARMKTDCGGALVWSEVTAEMLATTGADMQESEGVIDQLQSIDTMRIAILFKEVAPAVTKISVRSREQFNAIDVCTPFGGGGHHRAAGAEIAEPLATAREHVLTVARQLIDKSQ